MSDMIKLGKWWGKLSLIGTICCRLAKTPTYKKSSDSKAVPSIITYYFNKRDLITQNCFIEREAVLDKFIKVSP